MTSTYVDWGGHKLKLTWESGLLPERELITSVHGFCFKDGKLLMVDLDDRGWDFPGGHIEVGETAEVCFKREAMEEGYVNGRLHSSSVQLKSTIMKIRCGITQSLSESRLSSFLSKWTLRNYILLKRVMNQAEEFLFNLKMSPNTIKVGMQRMKRLCVKRKEGDK